MNKKILIILMVGLLIAVGVLLYFLLTKKPRKSAVTISSINLKKISDDQSFFPTLSQDEKYLLYFNRQTKPGFFRLSLADGKKEQITEIDDINNAYWSPDKTRIIFEVIYDKSRFEKYQSPFIAPETKDGEVNFWSYDFASKKLNKLDRNIRDVAWAHNALKIIYLYSDPVENINNISLSDYDGENWSKLSDTDCISCRMLYYSPDSKILFFEKIITDARADLYIADLKQNKTSVFLADYGQVKFSPKGDRLIIQDAAPDNLSLSDFSGKNKKDLKIQTLISKVTWSLDDIFVVAAVSQGEDKSDKFYKINLEDGQKTEIPYSSKDKISAQNLMLTKDGKTLYFTSGDILYKFEL